MRGGSRTGGARRGGRAGVVVALVWLVLLVPACAPGEEPDAGKEAPPESSAAPPSTEPEAGRRFVNDAAGYSLEVAPPWKQREGMGAGLVILDRQGSDAALAIVAKEAQGDLAGEYEELRSSLISERTGYRAVEESEVEIAGEPARLLVSENAIGTNERVTYNWVVVANGTSYVMGMEVPRERRDELIAEAHALLDTMVLFARRAV